ncbi:hypothetical protein GCM10010336_53530 [Streptomyces goshikiensis]|nr:hypothetical protein GCM10010336_53530 [Streptomyces goshikiensis]
MLWCAFPLHADPRAVLCLGSGFRPPGWVVKMYHGIPHKTVVYITGKSVIRL